jgi:hypothetical protein
VGRALGRYPCRCPVKAAEGVRLSSGGYGGFMATDDASVTPADDDGHELRTVEAGECVVRPWCWAMYLEVGVRPANDAPHE